MRQPLPKRIVQLTSNPFSNGMMWLLNVLLELNICARWRRRHDFWIESPDGSTTINPEELEGALWSLPVLWEKQSFNFEADVELSYEHDIDFARHPDRSTIVYVRDPRDAVFSAYRKWAVNRELEVDAEGYLGFLTDVQEQSILSEVAAPGGGLSGKPLEVFFLNALETWTLHTAFWWALRDCVDVTFLRFEDAKRDPASVVQRTLEVLGSVRTATQIDIAISNSSLEKFRASEARLQSATSRKFTNLGRSTAGEWRQHYGPEMLDMFSVLPAELLDGLGYEVAGEQTSNKRLCFSPEDGVQRLMKFLLRQKRVVEQLNQDRTDSGLRLSPEEQRTALAYLWAKQACGSLNTTNKPALIAFELFAQLLSGVIVDDDERVLQLLGAALAARGEELDQEDALIARELRIGLFNRIVDEPESGTTAASSATLQFYLSNNYNIFARSDGVLAGLTPLESRAVGELTAFAHSGRDHQYPEAVQLAQLLTGTTAKPAVGAASG